MQLGAIFVEVVESSKGSSFIIDDRYVYAEGLAFKYFGHLISSIYLSRGINLPDFHIPFKGFDDPFTLDVIVRSAYESCLTFYYVFLNPSRDDAKKFRYDSWNLAGLYQRQKYPAILPENVEKLKVEKLAIDKIQKNLVQLESFISLTPKQQKNHLSRLEKGLWKDKGWNEIALEAGFGPASSKQIYSLLSDRAHSGNLSVMQAWQAKSPQDKKDLIGASMGHLKICTAFMIMQYCKYLPKAKQYYIRNFLEPNVVTLWLGIGQNSEIETIF